MGAVDVGFSASDVDGCADAAGAPVEVAGEPEPEAELLTGAEVAGAEVADEVLLDPELPVLPEPAVPAVPVEAGPAVGDPVADGAREVVAAALEVGVWAPPELDVVTDPCGVTDPVPLAVGPVALAEGVPPGADCVGA